MGAKKTVETLVSGGQASAGPPLGPTLGPLGVNVLAIVNKINELTQKYSGMKVPVKITIDTETREFDVSVGAPTTSALIIRELNVEKGSNAPNDEKVGNLSIEQIIGVAKANRSKFLGKNLKAAAKEVLGSCVSIGVTVEDEDPREIQREVDEGKYDAKFESER
jgi:large subunit ribosomal protein L11